MVHHHFSAYFPQWNIIKGHKKGGTIPIFWTAPSLRNSLIGLPVAPNFCHLLIFFIFRFQQLGHCTDRTAILPRFQTSSGVSLDWKFVGTALMALMSLQLDWWRIWEEFIAVYLRWEVKPVHLQNCWISQHLERVRREKDGVCGAMVTWPPPVAGNGDRTSIFRI